MYYGEPDWVSEPVSPIIAIPASIILLVTMFIMFRSIWNYLKAVAELTHILEQRYPDIWQSLGNPHWIYIGNTQYLVPIIPFIRWLWKNDPQGLDYDDSRLYRCTRTLFKRSLQALCISGLLILMLVGISYL